MAIIQMSEEQGADYRSYLDSYRNKTGKEPTAIERTEAFLCARSIDPWNIPHWLK